MLHLLTRLAATLALTAAALAPAAGQVVADGSKAHPLRVLLIPADGGTESGTKADYAPVFNAISRTTGLQFDLKVGQSYGAVVEGMCNQLADIAFFGPVATVVGLVGAGGIGQELKGRYDMYNYAHVGTILVAIFLTVLALDQISARLRRRVA